MVVDWQWLAEMTLQLWNPVSWACAALGLLIAWLAWLVVVKLARATMTMLGGKVNQGVTILAILILVIFAWLGGAIGWALSVFATG